MSQKRKFYQKQEFQFCVLLVIAGLLSVFGIVPEEAVSRDAGWLSTAAGVIGAIIDYIDTRFDDG